MRKFLDWLSSVPKFFILGLTLTFLYFGYLIQIYGAKLIELKTMPLNEVGDFLAGVFGPVGFLWLVFGYFMQASEISATRRSIINQEEEKERAAQPIIEFSACEYGYGDHSNVKINLLEPAIVFVSKRCIAINLTNHGSLATNVRINSDHFSIFLPILKNGRNSVQEEFESEIKAGDSIEIFYIDSLGMSRKKVYKVYSLDKEIRDIPSVFSPPEASPLPNRLYQDLDIRPVEALK